LQQLLKEEIEALLRDEVSDPALDGVRVTSVELSVDYRNARVRFVSPGAHSLVSVERAFERATPFLRARLVDALGTKHAPGLRFVFDRDAAEGLAAPFADPEDPWSE
jgi:ribosome-binding factor A